MTRRRAGARVQQRRPRGVQLPQAKLTDDKVRAIRILRRSMSFSGIAVLFGISKSAAFDVASGRTWKHVEDVR